MLGEMYTAIKGNGKNLEIIFVSSDKDEGAFNSYYGEQPWCALPFAQRDLKEKLSKKFKVKGIPTLVFVDEDGSTITTDGREAISEDPEGEDFPWRPKPLKEVLGQTFKSANGDVPASSLEGKTLALYFRSNSPPRTLTHLLPSTTVHVHGNHFSRGIPHTEPLCAAAPLAFPPSLTARTGAPLAGVSPRSWLSSTTP